MPLKFKPLTFMLPRVLIAGLSPSKAILSNGIFLLWAIALWLWSGAIAQAAEMPMTVFRSPTCSCCGAWIEHLESEGFTVTEHQMTDMDAVKQEYGIPEEMASCHTALIDGYKIEGHVPAADIHQLLLDHPDVEGLAVPGMPVGSPGMESGDRHDAYTVFSFKPNGELESVNEYSGS